MVIVMQTGWGLPFSKFHTQANIVSTTHIYFHRERIPLGFVVVVVVVHCCCNLTLFPCSSYSFLLHTSDLVPSLFCSNSTFILLVLLTGTSPLSLASLVSPPHSLFASHTTTINSLTTRTTTTHVLFAHRQNLHFEVYFTSNSRSCPESLRFGFPRISRRDFPSTVVSFFWLSHSSTRDVLCTVDMCVWIISCQGREWEREFFGRRVMWIRGFVYLHCRRVCEHWWSICIAAVWVWNMRKGRLIDWLSCVLPEYEKFQETDSSSCALVTSHITTFRPS